MGESLNPQEHLLEGSDAQQDAGLFEGCFEELLRELSPPLQDAAPAYLQTDLQVDSTTSHLRVADPKLRNKQAQKRFRDRQKVA